MNYVTSDNSRHTATLQSAKIRQNLTSCVLKPIDEIEEINETNEMNQDNEEIHDSRPDPVLLYDFSDARDFTLLLKYYHETDEINETNKINETDEINQINERNETNETNQIEKICQM